MKTYKTDLLDLRCMDCMELLKTLPDKSFELAIVDPPYGIGVGSNMCRRSGDTPSGHGTVRWDERPPPAIYFEHLFRVAHHCIVWGGNYFGLGATRCYLAWDKVQQFSGADFELAWTNYDRPCKVFRMARVTAYGKGTIHPTQKPVELYKWLLANYARKGDRILDTHLGSGSIALACHDMGFHLTATELNADYFDNMVKRVKSETRQTGFGL